MKKIKFIISANRNSREKDSILNAGDIESQDSGCYKEVYFHPKGDNDENNGIYKDEDNGIYIRLGSWHDDKIHPEFSSFVGKKITITLKVE